MAKHSLVPHTDWDPMCDDYYDSNFNSYKEGPGARLDHSQQPWSSRSDQPKGLFKLYVKHIPTSVSQEGVEGVFKKHGNPVKVYRNPSIADSRFTWGFVFYHDFNEAEFAIRCLDNKPPLYLRVQFARSESEKERIRQEELDEAMFRSTLEENPYMYVQRDPLYGFDQPVPRGRGRGILQINEALKGRRHPSLSHMVLSDYEDYTLSGNGYDLYEPPVHEPYEDSNRAMMRSVNFTVDSSNGNRRMSMGRGYHCNSFRPGLRNSEDSRMMPIRTIRHHHHHHDERLLQSSIESIIRDKDSFEYGVRSPSTRNMMGICLVCRKRTFRFCERCRDPYCSRECQLEDWPNHKQQCISVPALQDACEERQYLLRQNGLHEHNTSPMDRGRVVCTSLEEQTSPNDSRRSAKQIFSMYNGIENQDDQRCRVRGDRKNSIENQDWNRMEEQAIPRNWARRSRKQNAMPRNAGKKDRNNLVEYEMQKAAGRGQHNDNNVGEPSPKDGTGCNVMENNDGHKGGDIRNALENQTNQKEELNNVEKYATPREGGNWNKKKYQMSKNVGRKDWNDEIEDEVQRGECNMNSVDEPAAKEERKLESTKRMEDRKRSDVQKNFSTHKNGSKKNNGIHGLDGSKKNFNISPRKPFGNQSQRQFVEGTMKSFKNKEPLFKTDAAKEDDHSSQTDSCKIPINTTATNSLQDILPQVGDIESVCNQIEELPSDEFSEVKLVYTVSPMEYWVQLVCSQSKLVDMLSEMMEKCESSPVCEPAVNAVCAVKFEEIWCRARILKVTPELKVHYLDFGNEEVCRPDQLKSLPPLALELPIQALRVKLAPGTPQKFQNLPYDSSLFVKPIEKNTDGSILVRIQNENNLYPAVLNPNTGIKLNSPPLKSTSENASTPKLKELRRPYSMEPTEPAAKDVIDTRIQIDSIVSLLKMDMAGLLEFRRKIDASTFTANVAFAEFADDLQQIYDVDNVCTSRVLDKKYQPKVKDLVLAFSLCDKKWYRAYVLAYLKQDYLVAFCDIAMVEKVKQVMRITKQFLKAPEMSVQCTVTQFVEPEEGVLEQLKPNATFQCDIQEVSAEGATFVVKTMDEGCVLFNAIATKWVPPCRNLICPKSIELVNGPCVLSVFHSPKAVYVRPLYKTAVENYRRVLQEVAGHCLTARPLDHKPVKGELVACKFTSDGNYYRALVGNVDETEVTVSYVDFGNSEVVTCDRLKPIPIKLQNIPCSAVKVILKDVLDKPLTRDATEYLNQLSAQEFQLKLELLGSKSEGVNIYMSDGTLINEKINSLLQPTWKKTLAEGGNPSEGNVYFFDEMKTIELPVGKTIDLMVMEVLNINEIMGCFIDSSDVIHVHSTLQEEINDYCKALPEQSYIPRKSELCLAKFAGEWFRAVCLEAVHSKVNVLFVDFGNISFVESTDVRQMIGDFYNYPAAASQCTIKDIPDDMPDNIKQRLKELIPPNVLQSIKVIEKTSTGTYVIDIPNVTTTLKNEDLFPLA